MGSRIRELEEKQNIRNAVWVKGDGRQTTAPAYVDESMSNELQKGCSLYEFFRLMAVCHTVVKDKVSGEYQAESPDEKALVDAAAECGYVFELNLEGVMTIRANGVEEKYEVKEIMEFNSTRKRMSILVRDSQTGNYRLFSKGADTIMFGRLSASAKAADEADYTEQLDKFAVTGLRTLVMAQKDITPADYNAWAGKMQDAINSGDPMTLEDRKEALYDELERDLEIVGASAIEASLSTLT